MTISTTVRSVDIPGNGTTTVFTIGFPWQQNADLVVTLINNSTLAETPWTLDVDYTLTGGDPTGTLTAAVAPASGYTIHVERVIEYKQTLDLIANDGFDAEAAEDAFDRVVMMIQQLADSGGSGGGSSGSITLANIGTGQGVSAGLVGSQYQLKGLKASGTGLAVASDADSITYALSGVLIAASNLSDVANRQSSLNNLTDVSAATNEHVLTKDTATGNAIWKVVPTGGSGEANTATSLGGTVSLPNGKVGVDLKFRGLTAGSNVTLTPTGNDVTIAATGEANTASATGASGVSPMQSTPKVGVDLRLRGIVVGTGIALSSNATDLTYSINLAAALAWTGQHTFTRNATGGSPTIQVNSLNNGALGSGGVLLTSDYVGSVDLRRTSTMADYDATLDGGGIFNAYGQHQVAGASTYTGPGLAILHGVYRGQVQANRSSGSHNADFVAFYAGGENLGTTPQVVYGHYADCFHNNSNANSASYGFVMEGFRSNSAGRVDGFVAKMMSSPGGLDGDTGYLIRRDGGSQKWAVGFGVGANGVAGAADIGFDATYGTIGTAAFRQASGQKFRLSGTDATTADIRNNTTSAMYAASDAAVEVLGGGTPWFGVRDADGIIAFGTAATATTVGAAGGASALPATPLRYLPAFIKVGGTMTAVKIPCYTF